MKKDLQGGLQNILDAINNLIEPKLGNLKYDRTYRGKITSNEGDNTYKVLVNGKEYSAIYTGNKIPVGQIVKVKAPLNNFSDIYIETLPGSGGGEEGDYNSLVNKPILNTNNTETQVARTAETIQGTISLHKISKTGNYNDLLNKPSLDFIPTSEKGQPNGVASLDENGKIVKSDLPTDTVYDSNYVHTDNNFTNALKDKLDSVEEGAEPNKIETIQKNGVDLDIVNKTVNVEVPTKTSDILNDSGFITNTVDNLTNYYLKSETYTQSEVNNLIGQIKTISIEVVDTLPTTGEDNKIYLVPKEGSTGDIYNEYIWVNNAWELIGTTQVDLTGYATEDWVNAQIKDFVTESQVTQIVNNSLTNYYTKTETYNKTEVNNLLSNKADTSAIPTKVSQLENDKGYLTEIPIASATVLGGIKVGENLSITTDGVLSAEAGGVSSYNDLTDKPILNTTNTNSLATNSNETINGTIDLHKVAKTGDYNDLNNKLNIVNGIATGSLRTIGSTEESDTYKLGQYAFAEGKTTKAIGDCSHAEGNDTVTGMRVFQIISGDSTAKTYVLSSIDNLRL